MWGINSGRILHTCFGAVVAHCVRRSNAFAFTLHSGDLRAVSNNGEISVGKAHGFANATSAVAASSAASLTELELLPHSSRAATIKAPTTYGSATLPTISQNALISKREPGNNNNNKQVRQKC
jgi:hypothetical protein